MCRPQLSSAAAAAAAAAAGLESFSFAGSQGLCNAAASGFFFCLEVSPKAVTALVPPMMAIDSGDHVPPMVESELAVSVQASLAPSQGCIVPVTASLRGGSSSGSPAREMSLLMTEIWWTIRDGDVRLDAHCLLVLQGHDTWLMIA